MSLANYLQINKWERPEKNFIYKVILISTLTGGIIAFSLSFQILYIFDTFSITLAGEFLMLLFFNYFYIRLSHR